MKSALTNKDIIISSWMKQLCTHVASPVDQMSSSHLQNRLNTLPVCMCMLHPFSPISDALICTHTHTHTHSLSLFWTLAGVQKQHRRQAASGPGHKSNREEKKCGEKTDACKNESSLPQPLNFKLHMEGRECSHMASVKRTTLGSSTWMTQNISHLFLPSLRGGGKELR